jgi:recombination associated protein RdgC
VFKNLLVYRLASDWQVSPEQVQACLHANRFVPCGLTQEKSVGWVSPRGEEHGPLLEIVAGQYLFKLMIETRSLPASVVRRAVQERAAHIEASTGRKPGKKELRDLKDDIRLELLPQSFTKQLSVMLWLDRQAGLLVVDAASTARADDAVTLLLQSLPGLALRPLHTQLSPASAMTQWLLSQEAPAGMSVDMDCELKAGDASKAVVRYARHRLDTPEVQEHVRAGKLPTRLALTWRGRVSFMLTEGMALKKLAFLEGVFDGHEAQDEGFDADAAIATGELQGLLADVIEALGGEQAEA